MSPQAGLSFDQAPPFALPLRFFLTAPLFLLAAAILIVSAPGALASRWSPPAFAVTHAVTLGFLAMVMLGALMQMLPVVAGSKLPAPYAVARTSHILLTLGTIALMAAFLTARPAAFGVAAGLLAAAFLVFLAAAAISLARAAPSMTVGGMRLAITSLVLTIGFGLLLALRRADRWEVATDGASAAHVAFGLLGWVLLLVIGVAYRVVPMFQITPPYPPRVTRWLVPALFAFLLLHAAAPFLPAIAGYLAGAGLATGILVFAITTLRLQTQRRRKLPDITLDYWRFAMASLIAGVIVWLTAQLWPGLAAARAYPPLLGILFLGGFAVSVVSGMLYKIVPFLAWFHLQAQLQARAGTIPTMKEMIGARRMRWQFRLHLAACGFLAAATLSPTPLPAIAGGLLLGASALLQWANLLSAVQRFRGHGGRFV